MRLGLHCGWGAAVGGEEAEGRPGGIFHPGGFDIGGCDGADHLLHDGESDPGGSDRRGDGLAGIKEVTFIVEGAGIATMDGFRLTYGLLVATEVVVDGVDVLTIDFATEGGAHPRGGEL